MKRFFLATAIFAVILASSVVSAKIHWLPDYLGDNLDRNRSTQKERPDRWNPGGYDQEDDSTYQNSSIDDKLTSSGECPNGWFLASELDGKGRDCVAKGSYPGIGICYGDCKCNQSTYKYSGNQCTGRYRCEGGCVDSVRRYRKQIDKCTVDYASKPWQSSCDGSVCDSYGNLTDCTLKCKNACCYYTDCSSYPHSSCPTGANCSSCQRGCGDTTKHYMVTSCKANYYATGNTCAACTWNGYTLPNCPDNASECYSSTCGGTTKYSVKSCKDGYTGSTCGSASSCPNGYYTSCSYVSNGTNSLTSTCNGKSGTSDCCTCSLSCDSGYTKSSGSCIASGCPSGYATTASGCGGATNGYYQLGSTSNGKSGSSTCYNCVLGCDSGYEKSGSSCVEIEVEEEEPVIYCTYTSSSCGENSDCYSEYCENKTMYRFKQCKSGFYTSCSGLNSACSYSFSDYDAMGCGTCSTSNCASGYVTSCTDPANGKATLSDTSTCGSKTCGTCTYSCDDGYTLSGTRCEPNSIEKDEEEGVTCTYTTASACKSAITGASSCTADSDGCYQLASCNTGSGYTKSGNTCTCARSVSECETHGYTVTEANKDPNGYYAYCNVSCTSDEKRYNFDKCNSGYATSASGCGLAPANGTWTATVGASANSVCRKCVIKCNDGYELSSDGTGCKVKVNCTYTTADACKNAINGAASCTADSNGCYQLASCDTSMGWTINSAGTGCTASACPSGYAVLATDCGTKAHGSYRLLNLLTNGYSGGSACKQCRLYCDDGYVLAIGDANTCIRDDLEILDPDKDIVVTSCPAGYATTASDCPKTGARLDTTKSNGTANGNTCYFCSCTSLSGNQLCVESSNDQVELGDRPIEMTGSCYTCSFCKVTFPAVNGLCPNCGRKPTSTVHSCILQ